MSERSPKSFDCVKSMRQTRDRVSAEIAALSYEELVKWIQPHWYTDPLLQRLA